MMMELSVLKTGTFIRGKIIQEKKMSLFKHQQDLLNLNPNKWMLMWSTGSGKTRTAIELAEKRFGHKLIICPKSLVENWKNEINKWTYGMGYVVLSKENFKKKPVDWCKFSTIIVDEAHYFSNYKSQMTKSLLAYLEKHNPPNIYLLTATPWLSSAWNIYTYSLIFGMGWKWHKFNQTFFSKVKLGNRFIPMPKKAIGGVPLAEYIGRLLNRFGNTIKLEDCFDVPEQIFQCEFFELTSEQKKAMKEVDDVLPIVQFTKDHQICGGTLKGDMYTKDQHFKCEKFDRVMELIDEHPQIAIVCRYNNEINYLYEKIRDSRPSNRVFRITGDVSGEERHHIVEEINKGEQAVVLVNSACSEGWGIPKVPLMVFYSLDFSVKNLIQMQGRIQRAGNIKKNVYLYLVVKNSVDEKIYESVAVNKIDFHVSLFDK